MPPPAHLQTPAPGHQVLLGIQQELAAQPVQYAFRVASSEMRDGYLIIRLRGMNNSPPLDESFEGSPIWWPGPPDHAESGGGEIIVVNPDSKEVVLSARVGQPPSEGGSVFIYPPRFLESLRAVWSDENWVRTINHTLVTCLRMINENGQGVELERYPWLRDHQKQCGRLPAWPISFLWGPPGTGKTTTVGALIASLLLERPHFRILLLSTTNSAIDQALVEVDKALEQARDTQAMEVRNACKRIGTQFVAKHYENRKHLLPQRNPELVAQLIAHQRNRPLQGNIAAEALWRETDDTLRQGLRAESQTILENSRLAVMTMTRAAFDLEMLRSLRTFDLLVIDEASQVSLAQVS
jgi:DNA replication ATP-dependent helicase Dna2